MIKITPEQDQILSDRFNLNDFQKVELKTLLEPPKAWQSRFPKNRSGHTLRIVFCECANAKGTVILSQGRAQTAEEWFEFANKMNDVGLNFVTYDPQGQGLSYRHDNDNTRHHIDTWQREVDDLEDVINFTKQFSTLRDTPKILLGHSRGGCTSLKFLAQHPDIQKDFCASVQVAPMLGLHYPWYLSPTTAKIWATINTKLGKDKHYADTQGPWGTDRYLSHINKITNDPVRAALQWVLFTNDPNKICGGATYGFVHEAMKSMNELATSGTPESIEIPTLFALGSEEKIPNNKDAIAFADRMPKGEIKIYTGAQHQVHMEIPYIRNNFYSDLTTFIKKHLPS